MVVLIYITKAINTTTTWYLNGFPSGSIGIPIYGVVYFVCDSASEFGAMGSTSFLGFSYLLLVFLNLLFLETCIIFFSQVLDFLSVFFFLIVIFLYLILG